MESRFNKNKLVWFLPVAIILFLYLLIQVSLKTELQVDSSIITFLATFFPNHIFTGFFTVVTELGSKYAIGILAIFLILWLWVKKKDFIGISVVVLAVGGGQLLNKSVKGIVGRERPEINEAIDALGNSFPSGHAMVGFMIYSILMYFLLREIKNRAVKIIMVAAIVSVILLIGMSRVVLSAHYPTDVLAGYSLAYIYIVCCLTFEQYLRNKFPRENGKMTM